MPETVDMSGGHRGGNNKPTDIESQARPLAKVGVADSSPLLLAASRVAQTYVSSAATAITEHVQQGPDGIRVVCFVGGLGVLVFGLISLISIPQVLLHPITYLINVYLTLFGVVTFTLEGNATWFGAKQKYVTSVQEYAKFLTLVGGRGLFYVFVASLVLVQGGVIAMIVGLYELFVGVVCVMYHLGVKPDLASAQAAIASGASRVTNAVQGAANQAGQHSAATR